MTDTSPDQPMTKAERDQLTKLARLRAKQAEREAEAREKVLLAEVQDQLTAEFDAHNALWADAVTIAEEAAAKANAHIRAVCADLGIPPKEAPQLGLGWHSRGPSYTDKERRAELRKLAATRLTALTKTAKAAIHDRLLDVETELIAGSLQSVDALTFAKLAMPRRRSARARQPNHEKDTRMKMLTIHNHQASESDFCWGVEGEIAIPTPVVCDRRDCGCDRAHDGLNSHKASTTLMVRDIDLDFDDLVTA